MTEVQLSLFDDGVRSRFFDEGDRKSKNRDLTPDGEARAFAVDVRNNVVLEASAGTGKTSVLVSRYVNLVKQGIEPSNILAITFTRKAAAEMRERIVAQLRDAAAKGEIGRARWTELRDRLSEIAISTIDAFCLSLLREFPLEADLDPGFEMADETEVPRIVDEALDRSLRMMVGLARNDHDIGLVLAQLGIARTREGLASLVDRRLVASSALDRFLARGPADLTPRLVCQRAADALDQVLRDAPGGLSQFLADGPSGHGRYQLFTREVGRLRDIDGFGDAEVRGLLERIGSHFLTNEGEPRRSGRIYPYVSRDYPTKQAERRHREALFAMAPQVDRVVSAFHRDLNVILARGVRRMFAVALQQYRTALEERAVLDFPDVLQRALDLLRNMGEFSQSRYRLESRYHHVLVDEFQDTSRAQWQLISLLIQAWGEGFGLASQPSIFIVGDRKQSIYRFRDAEVSMLREAAAYIDGLRPGAASRRSISRSFRAVPALQAFVNDVFTEMAQPPDPERAAQGRADDFTFEETDRFPVTAAEVAPETPPLGIAVGDSPEMCAAAVATEIRRILAEDDVRDRDTGVRRRAAPGDIAILFRSRTSHREFERELIAQGIPTYVYKGLGFFDSDEIKDLLALLRYLANPASDLRAAALLRSRFIRFSDAGLAALAPRLAAALNEPLPPAARAVLDGPDQRVLDHAREFVPSWIAQVDRVPSSELLEQILTQTAYAYELRGPRRLQAWENVKKMRGLVRRMQNRGYATITRLADHLDSLGAGEESNAVLEAVDSVNLMTIHASKGLEFPIVFLVNLARGASGPPHPVRVIVDGNTESVSVGRFASEMEEADRERDRHETRRLLYVAMTRARDRLYLSSSLKDRELSPGRGSLADILPESIKVLFARAGGALDGVTTLAWRGVSGTTFEFRLCATSPSSADVAPPQPSLQNRCVASQRDVLGTDLPLLAPSRIPVTALVSDDEVDHAVTGSGSDRITGTLVHRLFHFAHLGSGVGEDEEAQLAFARGMLTAEERASVPDVESLVRAGVSAWRRLATRPDVLSALASGERFHEVPLSFVVPGFEPPTILRGTIDCLIRRPDESILVVEFKTGHPHPSHDRQLDLYVQAIQASQPGAIVERMLVYS